MRYTGPAQLTLTDDELRVLYHALQGSHSPDAIELRVRILTHINQRDMMRHLQNGGTVDTWNPQTPSPNA